MVKPDLRPLWELYIQIGRFTMYVGLGEIRMKPAVQQRNDTEANSLLFFGGLDSQIPRPRLRPQRG